MTTEDLNRKKALGRGLSALLGGATALQQTLELRGSAQEENEFQEISLPLIDRCEDQPRKYFDLDEMVELAMSIESKGVLQPILLRKHPKNPQRFEIIAGERRYRAAKLARLEKIPALIKSVSEQDRLEIALLENIQRLDLNAIEEAEAYQQLMEKYDYTQEKLSEVIGKSRSHIANTLRLLKLPNEAKNLLINKQISAGHARAILGADNPLDLTQKIVEGGLSVRDAEEELKPDTRSYGSRSTSSQNEDLISLASYISGVLECPVKIVERERGGEVILRFRDSRHLDCLVAKFNSLSAPVDMDEFS